MPVSMYSVLLIGFAAGGLLPWWVAISVAFVETTYNIFQARWEVYLDSIKVNRKDERPIVRGFGQDE